MFELVSHYQPSGDQPQAIEKLVEGIKNNEKYQVLLGATGTGKTFTIANVIAKVNKPTLVLANNKTLAGQLYAELKELFPNNHVEYFVSYYDYYQPEAYVAKTDTYIEKDAAINDEIDELRHSATAALLNNRDVIVVASVSCIYGIGEKEEYRNKMLTLTVGDKVERNQILEKCKWGKEIVLIYISFAFLCFVYYYPVLSGNWTTREDIKRLQWFPTWYFMTGD